jgi:hypothetical protein
MSWANLDDRLHAHPKVRKLQRIPFAGAEAFGVWCWCLSWARAYAPNTGIVPLEVVTSDWNADADHFADIFALLLRVGLVDESEPGTFGIHDWADWQLVGHPGQVKAGKARAASAARNELGRFAPDPAPLEYLVKAGIQPGHASPLHTTPLPAPARGTTVEGPSEFRQRVTGPRP